MSTTVKEAFKDYKEQGSLSGCNVLNINLYKKSKRVEVDIEADKEISLEEIYIFKNYLKRKFDVEEAIAHIKYEEDVAEPPVSFAGSLPLVKGARASEESRDVEIQIYKPLILGRTEKIKDKIISIADLNLDYGKIAIEGKVVSIDSREIKNGKILAAFNVYDGTSTITCKAFLEKGKAKNILERINESKRLRLAGNLQYDNYSKDLNIIANVIVEIPETEDDVREDLSDKKRVELHLHTQMSQLDGVSSAASLIKKAASWGMKAIAITDHGVVQAFPEAKKASSDLDIKVIYGVEAYIVPDCKGRHRGRPSDKNKEFR